MRRLSRLLLIRPLELLLTAQLCRLLRLRKRTASLTHLDPP